MIMYKVWWILMNSLIYYAEIDFSLRFTGNRKGQYVPWYILINALLTAVAIQTQMFRVFGILHIALFFFLMAKLFKISPKYAITPAVIMFTLSTFMEGFITIFMHFLSLSLRSQILGLVFHCLMTAGQSVLFFLVLRLIAKRYSLSNHNLISTYLYILLLPCSLMIGGIRFSLGLDSSGGKFSHGALIGPELGTALCASLWMTGVLLVFFIIIEVFFKVITMSQQEMDQALLAGQIKEQYSYIQEAQRRNERYRSFQHDINNHLLVLSGLLHSSKYDQAEHYLQKLDKAAKSLFGAISTGNSVLDVLLWEKIRYAEQYEISVTCDVLIPKKIAIDDIDLCILFSNGMDNAVNACKNAAQEHRTITLTSRQKHDFLLIEMVNGVDCLRPFSYGTGLKNIELTAKKYDGTIQTEQTENQFFLSILLCRIHC